MSDLIVHKPREVIIRPQVGLMLSIGEPPAEGRNYPKKIDHFRAKPGSEGQYAVAVDKFETAYPTDEAKKRIEIAFISNSLSDCLDIRYKAWGTSGLRAIGQTNFALAPERMLAFDDVLTAFPEDRPEAIEYQLKGPDDPIVGKVGLKLYGVLRFAIPPVTGLTTLAEISTTSKRTMANWLAGLNQTLQLSGGQLAGLPLILAVRPARTRYFDAGKKKRSTSTFFEVVIEAQHSIDEFMELVQTRRIQMGTASRLELPPVDHANGHRDEELAPALWPGASGRLAHAEPDLDEQQHVREEPTVGQVDEARLNRIVRLIDEVGESEAGAVLAGVFGADDVRELNDADAERFEQMLHRAAEARVVEGEIVDEPESAEDAETVDDDGSVFEKMASEAQTRKGDQ